MSVCCIGSVVISQWFSGWDVHQNPLWGFLEIKMSVHLPPFLLRSFPRGVGKDLCILKKLHRWFEILLVRKHCNKYRETNKLKKITCSYIFPNTYKIKDLRLVVDMN